MATSSCQVGSGSSMPCRSDLPPRMVPNNKLVLASQVVPPTEVNLQHASSAGRPPAPEAGRPKHCEAVWGLADSTLRGSRLSQHSAGPTGNQNGLRTRSKDWQTILRELPHPDGTLSALTESPKRSSFYLYFFAVRTVSRRALNFFTHHFTVDRTLHSHQRKYECEKRSAGNGCSPMNWKQR